MDAVIRPWISENPQISFELRPSSLCITSPVSYFLFLRRHRRLRISQTRPVFEINPILTENILQRKSGNRREEHLSKMVSILIILRLRKKAHKTVSLNKDEDWGSPEIPEAARSSSSSRRRPGARLVRTPALSAEFGPHSAILAASQRHSDLRRNGAVTS